MLSWTEIASGVPVGGTLPVASVNDGARVIEVNYMCWRALICVQDDVS